MTKKNKLKLIINSIKDSGLIGFLNLIKYQIDLKLKKNTIFASPISIQIEPTVRCNLSCEMCEHSFHKMNKNDLSIDQLKYILKEFPFLKNITLQGLGEPLLNKDLFSMIEEVKKRNIRIGITTNATLLTDEIGQKLIDSKIDWIYISLDAASKELYEKIRRGAEFERVINNVINFLKNKKDRLPETNFWTLLMKENINKIPGVVKFAKELGIKKVVLQNIHNWGHESFKEKIKSKEVNSEEKISELIKNIKEVKGDVKVEINTNTKENVNLKCDWPWRSLYLTVDGFITPCCMQGADPDIINFGNIFKTPVKQILNNQEYRNFRNKLKSSEIPKVCLGCPAYYKQKVIKI